MHIYILQGVAKKDRSYEREKIFLQQIIQLNCNINSIFMYIYYLPLMGDSAIGGVGISSLPPAKARLPWRGADFLTGDNDRLISSSSIFILDL